MKHVLLVSYSQTGQLDRLAASFAEPLNAAGITVERLDIVPQTPYPFPWPFMRFFNTFPETVHLQPAPIVPPAPLRQQYDLVVIAYTVWFLSPSQPVTAFMQSPAAAAILRDTPVITLIGCRNMWLNAQEKMKTMIARAGGRLVGNVVKIDQCSSAASFITTPAWLLTGRKQIGNLPEAGIAAADIADAARFGVKTATALTQNQRLDETLLRGMGAVNINERLIASENIAHRSFQIWGALLMRLERISPLLRQAMLCFYIAFLITLILTVVPISAVIKKLIAPYTRSKIQAQKAYYSAPSGGWETDA